jgi:hypothetical protein
MNVFWTGTPGGGADVRAGPRAKFPEQFSFRSGHSTLKIIITKTSSFIDGNSSLFDSQ